MLVPVKSEKHLENHKGEVLYLTSRLCCSERLYLWAVGGSSLIGPVPSEIKDYTRTISSDFSFSQL